MKVEVGKKYLTARSLDIVWECVFHIPNAPVYPYILICKDKYEGLLFVTEEGFTPTNQSLIEWSPYKDFKKDDPVMVSRDGVVWGRRYFSHVANGVPYAFMNGATSWTIKEELIPIAGWRFCRRPTEEELNS